MRQLKQLNIEKSIKQEKLIFKESWFDKFDAITVYLVFGWFVILPFLMFFDPYRTQGEIGYYLIFIMTFFGIYVIYRKATEKRLINIPNSNDQERNRQLINEYCQSEKFNKYRNATNIIIYTEDADFSINPKWKTSYIFLFKNNTVLFTVLKERFKLNLPTLTKHLFVKRDLKKILNK
ncbi:MAG TPA: hypothetical protein PLP27_02385 [Crocinitomicaceae bacterium]|nr:hypothetical protein [Crocinitomicaceae bacterium]